MKPDMTMLSGPGKHLLMSGMHRDNDSATAPAYRKRLSMFRKR